MGKILYAEDEFTNRKIMEVQCRKAGVECCLAEDGREALNFMKQEEFDVIILDQYMPGLNGDVLIKEARILGITTPLIAITSDDSMIDHLKSCGFDDVYIKPLRSGDYNDIISTHCAT
ncbi:MAG: response regulator [Spirochaetales bacterium]|nr:response regulator [Spirochaetales bacterium]